MATTNTARVEESDSLASLEERIVRAVQLVSQLRSEKDATEKQLQSVVADRNSVQASLADLQAQNAVLTDELESLKEERKQVRGRIEKLLGQMDLLSAG